MFQPMLTQIYVAIWRHQATGHHCDLVTPYGGDLGQPYIYQII